MLKHHRLLQVEARLHAGASWVERDLVFCNARWSFLEPSTLREQFLKVLEEMGFPHMRFHDLRHTAATLLLSMGVPMRVVQDILGHSEMKTTANVYSHVLHSMQREAMGKMDELLGRQDQAAE